jgi:hypothetical protein
MRRAALLLPLCLWACSERKTSCDGAAASTALVEGYCPSGEADRCYFEQAPLDGF